MNGLSTRYIRTGPMNPRNQVSTQALYSAMWGAVLSTDDLLTLCAESGVTARLENGRVMAQGKFWEQHVETARQVEQIVAERAA